MNEKQIPWRSFNDAASKVIESSSKLADALVKINGDSSSSGQVVVTLRDAGRLAAATRDGAKAALAAGVPLSLTTEQDQLSSAATKVAEAAEQVKEPAKPTDSQSAAPTAAVAGAANALQIARSSLDAAATALKSVVTVRSSSDFTVQVKTLEEARTNLDKAAEAIGGMQAHFGKATVKNSLAVDRIGISEWIVTRSARGAVQLAFAALSAGRVALAMPEVLDPLGKSTPNLSSTNRRVLETRLDALAAAAARLDACDPLSTSLRELLPTAARASFVREWFPVDPEMVPLKSSGLIPSAMTPAPKEEEKAPEQTFDDLIKKLLIKLAT